MMGLTLHDMPRPLHGLHSCLSLWPAPWCPDPTHTPLLPACSQFARGLLSLHKLSMVHGDVKLLNVLVHPEDGSWYVADLGSITWKPWNGQPALCK